MNIEITCRNCELNDHLKRIIDQKFMKLDKYFDEQATVKVCLKKQASKTTTEVMLDYTGKFVRATATGENFYDNLDEVLPKIEGQIRKHRTRFDKHQKNVSFKEDSVYDNENKWENKSTGSVVKEKAFKLKPMTVNEAIEEMELLGHSFYVFLEAKTHSVQVLYLRSDGDLGLIEPEI